jgi:type II secretory pathway component PulM
MNEPLRTERPVLRERLRDKLPEILIEAASVVLALLLALAVNEWHERRQENERALDARRAILAELRANSAEIRSSRAALKDIVQTLRGALDDSKPAANKLKIDLGISLLSAAAWRAALATQASQRIDFDWITRIAKVYELQDNFLRVQNAAIDQLNAVPSDSSADGRQIASTLLPRFRALDQFAQGLAANYAETLDEAAAKRPDTKP